MKKYVSLPIKRNKNVEVELLTLEEFEKRFKFVNLWCLIPIGIFESISGLKYFVFQDCLRRFCIQIR